LTSEKLIKFFRTLSFKLHIYPDPISRKIIMHISRTSGPANWTDKQGTAAKTYLLCNKTVLT